MRSLLGKISPPALRVRRTAPPRGAGHSADVGSARGAVQAGERPTRTLPPPGSRIGQIRALGSALRLLEGTTSNDSAPDDEPIPADAAGSAGDVLSEVVAGAGEAVSVVGGVLWSACDATASALVGMTGVVVGEVAGGVGEVAKVVGETALTAAGAAVDLVLEV